MLKIRLLKDGRVVETFDAKWTINIADIASEAGELEPQHGADDWEIVNDHRRDGDAEIALERPDRLSKGGEWYTTLSFFAVLTGRPR
jgi:hypothetical protein